MKNKNTDTIALNAINGKEELKGRNKKIHETQHITIMKIKRKIVIYYPRTNSMSIFKKCNGSIPKRIHGFKPFLPETNLNISRVRLDKLILLKVPVNRKEQIYVLEAVKDVTIKNNKIIKVKGGETR